MSRLFGFAARSRCGSGEREWKRRSDKRGLDLSLAFDEERVLLSVVVRGTVTKWLPVAAGRRLVVQSVLSAQVACGGRDLYMQWQRADGSA